MKKRIDIAFLLIVTALFFSCYDSYPVDGNGLIISDKGTCYMSSFDLLGADNQNCLVERPTVDNGLIDTVECTVTAVAMFGTNLKHVKPYCSVTDQITVSPFMGEWIDFTGPRKYTLTSGNRQIKKEYTIVVTVEQ